MTKKVRRKKNALFVVCQGGGLSSRDPAHFRDFLLKSKGFFSKVTFIKELKVYRTYAIHSRTKFSNFNLFCATISQVFSS